MRIINTRLIVKREVINLYVTEKHLQKDSFFNLMYVNYVFIYIKINIY